MVRSILLATTLSLVTTLPLAWKWQLGMRRTAVAVAGLSVLAGLVIERILWSLRAPIGIESTVVLTWLLTLGAALGLLLYRFFRDPERTVPLTRGVIVSPADGEVVYVRQSQNGMLPVSTKQGRRFGLSELTKTPLQMNDAIVIGIGMSFLDVHVNRAPIAGRILMKRHFSGLFGSLRQPPMVFSNERMTTIIQHASMQVAVVQIASRLVRQIVSYVAEGQQVERGQRIGVIRFGSQVDLVLPRRPDMRVTVEPGDRVTAGESIVAVYASMGKRIPVTKPYGPDLDDALVSSTSATNPDQP